MADLADLQDDLDYAIEAIETARETNNNAPGIVETMAVNLLIAKLGKPRGELVELVKHAVRYIDR